MNVTQTVPYRWVVLLLAVLAISHSVVGQESGVRAITLENVEPPAAIAPDEPFAKAFSLEQTARYLDNAALHWQKTHACTACHTMLPYLMAQPALNALAPQSAEVRQFFEQIVAGKRQAMPDYSCKDVAGAVAIGVASAITINDRWAIGKLHPLTHQALDRMWTLERSDGSWEWPFRDTPPLKINEHSGVTLAAIAAGMAPDDYATTPAAKAGLVGVRRFLSSTKAVSLHQKAMLLWASVYVDGLLSADAKAEILSSLVDVQLSDGGWSLASLVDNTNDPSLDNAQAIQAKAEKGYGTEFLAYVGRDRVEDDPELGVVFLSSSWSLRARSALEASICRSRTNVRMISTFTWMARELFKTLDNMATPYWVKAYDGYRRPPQLEVTNCDLKFANWSRVS